MIGDAMRIQNTVFDVDFLASKVVSQPLHSVTATSLRAKPLSLRALRRGHDDDAQVRTEAIPDIKERIDIAVCPKYMRRSQTTRS